MVSFGDIVTAAGLAMRIVQVLYDSPRALEDYQDAMTELVSLHRELVLINDTIQLAATSRTGELIRRNVAGEVRGCLVEMQRFLDKTKGVAETGMVGVFSGAQRLGRTSQGVAQPFSQLVHLVSKRLPGIISTATRDEVRMCSETIQELAVALKPVSHPVPEDIVFIFDPMGHNSNIRDIRPDLSGVPSKNQRREASYYRRSLKLLATLQGLHLAGVKRGPEARNDFRNEDSAESFSNCGGLSPAGNHIMAVVVYLISLSIQTLYM
ncbi:hypothetical protein C8R45DRAFT_1073062 [Mycena sanguinolenta]|nr:hypothetical protein C8R45DRAFT_1073062 [Mycena sanguinolenta]